MPVAAGVVGDLGITARRVLAARDMAAERCRAAALDRTHHLQLREAHMPLIGFTPSRAVIAEDVRDLQSSLRTPAARRVQALQGTLDLGNHSGGHATVAGRRLELGMSEQRLNHANVRAALEQMGREAVAKGM